MNYWKNQNAKSSKQLYCIYGIDYETNEESLYNPTEDQIIGALEAHNATSLVFVGDVEAFEDIYMAISAEYYFDITISFVELTGNTTEFRYYAAENRRRLQRDAAFEILKQMPDDENREQLAHILDLSHRL